MSNNLFVHSSKELSTDAFMAWLFVELAENNELRKFQKHFLESIGINDIQSYEKAEPFRQRNNIDLLVELTSNSTKIKLLFENKTNGTIRVNKHSYSQIEKYKKSEPNCKYYFYLKLAYIDPYERKLCKEHGYEVISSEMLVKAIEPFEDSYQIIKQYYEYLNGLIEDDKDIEKQMSHNNAYIYKERTAQRKLIGKIFEEINKSCDEFDMDIISGANKGGSSWTHLTFYWNEKAFEGVCEGVWWRIDKDSKETYLRLNYYAKIDEKHRKDKFDKAIKIKNEFEHIKGDVLKWIVNDTSKYALKETVIATLYFKDNEYQNIVKEISRITISLREKLLN